MTFMTGTLRGRLYLALILASVLTVGFVCWQRYGVEKENNQIDIVLNYDQILELSLQSDEDISWWLTELGNAGATAVAIQEDVLINYLKENFVTYHLSGELKQNAIKMAGISDEMRIAIENGGDYDLVIVTETADDKERLYRGLNRYESIEMVTFDDGFIIHGTEEDLLYEVSGDVSNADGIVRYSYNEVVGTKYLQLPIGFDDSLIALSKSAGLQVLLRPVNHSDFSTEMVDNYMAEIDKYDNVMPLLIAAGSEELGYNRENLDYIEDVWALIEKYDYKIALTESTVQRQYGEKDGLPELVDAYEETSFVRLFSIWPYIQERYIYPGYSHGEEIGNAMYRAITERNIRVIYFNPFKWDDSAYVTNIEDYNQVFKTLSDRLKVHGYSLGSFTTLKEVQIPHIFRIFLYVEVLLFGVILLNEGIFRMNRWFNGFLIIMAVLGGIGLGYAAPNLSIKLFALLSSVIFASLASVVYYQVFLGNSERRGSFKSGLLALITAGFTALLGGLYIGSIMAYNEYFLEIEIFSGVKLSLLAPIAVTILFMAIQYIKYKAQNSEDDIMTEAKKGTLGLLRMPIQLQHALLMGIALVLAYIYLARSGHETNVEPSSLEIIMRNILENIFPARPRNKEFLLAYPAIVLGMTLKPIMDKRTTELRYMSQLIFMGLAAIGFTSVTNTFSHIRTPLMMSVVRTLISIGLGMVIALVIFVGVKVWIWLYHRLYKMIVLDRR